MMKPREQLSLMDKVIRELDDLKSSQTSVLKKISQIEADNINLNIGVLSDGLPDIHEEVDDALTKASELLDKFTEHRNKYEEENQQFLTEAEQKK
jgi:prefoldin subunit 5